MREWWRGGVIYQVYPRSFQDSDGDGIGDLPGILDRLDHVASLGVDCIGQRVDHRVDIGRDVQPVHHGVITRVDECGHCVIGIREAHGAQESGGSHAAGNDCNFTRSGHVFERMSSLT